MAATVIQCCAAGRQLTIGHRASGNSSGGSAACRRPAISSRRGVRSATQQYALPSDKYF